MNKYQLNQYTQNLAKSLNINNLSFIFVYCQYVWFSLNGHLNRHLGTCEATQTSGMFFGCPQPLLRSTAVFGSFYSLPNASV